jgi:uncharacterized protein YkwD
MAGRQTGGAVAIVTAMVFAGASLLACGSKNGKVGSQPTWRKPSLMHGDNGKPPVAMVFAPSAAAVEAYNDPPRTDAPSTPLGDAIVAGIVDVCEQLDLVAPVPDGRLFTAADELAAAVPEDAPLAYPMVEFALQRNGIIEPSPHLVVIWGPLDDPNAIMEQLGERLPSILGSGSFSRVGIGMSRREGSSDGVAILALQSSNVQTEPIPRALPDGGTIDVEGKVLGAYRSPEVFVTHEDGSVTRPTTTLRGTQGFAASVTCGGHVGRQQIEITAVDSSGSTVMANFPVWCNAEAPTSVTIEVSEDDLSPVANEQEAEERMLRLVNDDREDHGLPPLQIDQRVAKVARAHSTEMHDTGVVAHVSPTTGSAADRVKAANIGTSVVLENVARAYGVGEAEEGLMNSPGHRANLLSKQVTHIGIGIVFGDEVAGRREMFVTQVFTRVPPKIEHRAVVKVVQEKIDVARDITHDTSLGELAQRYADDIAGGKSTEEASKRSKRRMKDFAPQYSRVTTVVSTVADVDAFNPDTVLTDRKTTHYGVGVAQGQHDVIGEGAIYIVLMVARER